MICDPGVSLIVPSRKTLCPASPSLEWVPWTSVPHLPGHGCFRDPRYYDRLRLPDARLAALRFRWRCDTMLALWFRSSALESALPTPWTLFRRCPSGCSAWKHQALSSSRVIPLCACHDLRSRWCPFRSPLMLRGLLPSAGSIRRLWLRCSGVILMTTTIHISGFNNTACNLFRPASHLPSRERTRASLPTCRLCLSRVGLEQTALSPTG
jgi:hypothetical protein